MPSARFLSSKAQGVPPSIPAIPSLIAVSFLSAEGLELMTNIRDTNIILADDYDNWDSLGAPINTTTYYYKVDFNSLIATSVSSISNAILQKNDQGIFLHDSSYANSVFKRIISTKSDDNFSSTTIESWIQWENRGNTYDYKIETILYDLSF